MTKTARRQPGEGGLYQRADGIWIGVVDLGFGADGKRRRKTVSAKKYDVAQRKFRELRKQLDGHGDLPTASMTVEKWLTRWLEEIIGPHIKPRALQGYRTCVHQHLIPYIGKRRLDQLAPQHVRDMHKALEKRVGLRSKEPLAAGTILKAHRVLAKALTDAQREGLITRNVASLVDAPRKAPGAEGGILSSSEAKTLLQSVAAHDLASRWATALLLGARQGEALGLEWSRVDFAHRTIDLSWQLQRLGYKHDCEHTTEGTPTCGRKQSRYCPERTLEVPRGFEFRQLDGGLTLTRPKSRAGRRVSPLPAPLLAMLELHLSESDGKPNPHGLVWTRATGQPIEPRDDYDAWMDALEGAGLPRIPLHSARHTTATLLLEAGVDAHVIKSILGHSEVVTTRGYQHVDLTLARAALDQLGTSLT